MKKTAKIEIPQAIHTSQFLRFAAFYIERFKKENGCYGKPEGKYGRWLAEYRRMDELGMLTPEKIREQYIKILDGSSTKSYIYWDAIYYIGMQALDAAKAFIETNSFDIRVITGEIAINDDDEELTGLSLEEAISICKSMNEEAEELLFKVYDSSTNKPI